jgi:hypothetical protein
MAAQRFGRTVISVSLASRSSAYQAAASIAARFPVLRAAGWANNVTQNLCCAGHATEPAFWALLRCGRHDFGDGLAEAGDANWLARLADFFEDAEALSFELGDSDFFHRTILLTMVNSTGPTSW